MTSEFIAHKITGSVKILPTEPIKAVILYVRKLFHYTVKYGKAWKAKQAAFRILYGDWEESYNRIGMVLGAMAATNRGMYYVVEPQGSDTRTYEGQTVQVFGRAFWTFEPCIRAFKHCRPVMSVDGTFLTGKFRGTIMVAVGHDAGDRLVPLAFALVSAENNDNWEWFLGLVRTKIVGPGKDICIISDHHQGILHAVEIEIPGYGRVHHRWCMRHFVSNFYRACGNKELSDELQDCCLAFTARHFKKLYDKIFRLATPWGKEFLTRNLKDRNKWSRAYESQGMRYGDMTSNMAECFNKVLKGVRALPVSAILEYTFIKMIEYFLKWSEVTAKQIAGDNKRNKKFEYPPKIDKWMVYQKRKADTLEVQEFENT